MINIIRYLHKKGTTSCEVAEYLKVSKKTVLRIAKQNGIIFNNIPKRFDTVDPIIIKKLIKRNYRDVEIAKMLNINRQSVNRICLKNKIKRNYKIKLTKREKAVIIGTLLGDASLKFSGRQTSITFVHSLKQKEYCIWKAEQLKRLGININQSKRNIPDKRNGNYYEAITVNTKGYLNLTDWYKKMYTPKKVINEELLKHYNALSLAIHFMDDGYKHNSYGLSTDCFSKKDLLMFNDFCLKKFNIIWTITKANRLYLPAKYKDRFTKLIKPYIHKELEYKLHKL